MIYCVVVVSAQKKGSDSTETWRRDFKISFHDIVADGSNEYFILKAGRVMMYQGKENGKNTVLTITVLNETKMVDGFETRVVEEKETQNGQLAEVSRNYFGINKRMKDVYYFGEAVDMYKHGKIVSHEGSWESGVSGAKFGLALPGSANVGDKYYQEQAADAKDRIEIVSLEDSIVTPAGKFVHCLKTKETSPLEPGVVEYKIYAPGVGLVKDDSLKLVSVKN
jgi:hypothetical protein